MAVNSERNMRADLETGVLEGTYIKLSPMLGGVFEPRTERLTWPTYAQAERHADYENPALVNRKLIREPGPRSVQYVVPADNPALGR